MSFCDSCSIIIQLFDRIMIFGWSSGFYLYLRISYLKIQKNACCDCRSVSNAELDDLAINRSKKYIYYSCLSPTIAQGLSFLTDSSVALVSKKCQEGADNYLKRVWQAEMTSWLLQRALESAVKYRKSFANNKIELNQIKSNWIFWWICRVPPHTVRA